MTFFQNKPPNKSLQPIPINSIGTLGSSRSRGLFYVAVPAWLSFGGMKSVICILSLVVILFAGCYPNPEGGPPGWIWNTYDVPQYQKLTDFTNSTLEFTTMIQHKPPYQFLIGVPQSLTNRFSIKGDIILRESNSVVLRIPVSSHDLTPCNWLYSSMGLNGYLLTSSRDNYTGRNGIPLLEKHTYDVHINFDEPPPTNSALWFCSWLKTH